MDQKDKDEIVLAVLEEIDNMLARCEELTERSFDPDGFPQRILDADMLRIELRDRIQFLKDPTAVDLKDI